MYLWISEWKILTPKNSSDNQTNVTSSQELLHEEATFYPVLTEQVILEIPPEFLGKLTPAGIHPHPPLHREKHGPHAPSRPLTHARTLQ